MKVIDYLSENEKTYFFKDKATGETFGVKGYMLGRQEFIWLIAKEIASVETDNNGNVTVVLEG